MHNAIEKCPVCQHDLVITQLSCTNCDTKINGNYQHKQGPFSVLNEEQTNFLLSFVKCEGRFNRMEGELGLSYPTLRNRFNEIVKILGGNPQEELRPLNKEDRIIILNILENDIITLQEAQTLLKTKTYIKSLDVRKELVWNALEEGEINAEEAVIMLKEELE
eukprot:Anaeramoba_ignava/a608564_24.p1 GENE.a608564_24~~a608564_24.p1  ORF type:complete len:163 (-),score=26.99 a608564_24:846-1334(-)